MHLGNFHFGAFPQCLGMPLGILSFPLLLEYAAINSMLDQINSCLDHLEEKNDHLHICLKELLESNRQTRLEFQQQNFLLQADPGDKWTLTSL
uniref:Uncharacterized protein n=1 Tax=Zonotrichia albicollis TaxID=44394 RepID=A0A8D2QAD6_ZONAL